MISASEELFNAKWSVYQKVVAADYMLHRHFAALTRTSLALQASSGDFAMLDIGCGDASSLVGLIQSMPLKSYTGYDMSESALQDCAANLAAAAFPVNLVKGDMAALIQTGAERFDLVYSSYAIHHLPDHLKKDFFKLISNRLNPGGRFIYIDIYRQEGQSLQEYREAYADWIRTYWTLLSIQEKEEVISHLSQCDYPARAADISSWAMEAGLKTMSADFGNDRHLFICFQKFSQ